MIQIRLRFINPYKETFYFVSLGEPWPHNAELFRVQRTTPHKSRARIFDNAEQAASMLEMFGSPPGWDISIEDTRAKL